MVQKTINLTLGGQERTLLYGTMGYFEHIKAATGKEPFEWLEGFDKNRQGGNQITVLIEDTAVMVYAGLNSYLDSMDQPNVPFDKVKKWCNGLSTELIGEIFTTAFGNLATDRPGELTAQPGQENGEAKVNV